MDKEDKLKFIEKTIEDSLRKMKNSRNYRMDDDMEALLSTAELQYKAFMDGVNFMRSDDGTTHLYAHLFIEDQDMLNDVEFLEYLRLKYKFGGL